VSEPAGNHVILDLGGGEYALLAHFRKPHLHLHLHLQDLREFRPGGATGLPIRFHDVLVNGVLHRVGVPTSGQFVRQAPRRP